ncbi:MAG TPA: von Willebrand factor type A domain-containing protein [Thermoanaerobaculia bacterium]|nr:von Willebrand factor type A domain-containing protein [Thermoanaerobaculia bacterium]
MKRNIVVFLVLLSLACHTGTGPAVRPGPGGAIHGVAMMDGAPLPGVTVTLSAPGQPSRVAISDVNGRYSFMGLMPGTYTVDAHLESLTRTTVQVAVTRDQGVTLTTVMRMSAVAESITVTAAAPVNGFAALPKTRRPLRTSAAQTAPSDTYAADFVTEVSVPLPVSTPAVPEIEYARIEEHGFVETKKERVATFAIDVDRASYANVRRYLRDGLVPPADAVRIEEMVNYFTYSYPQPSDDAPFSITTEVAGCPWNPERRLLRVGVQGRNLDQWRMAPNNLVFLIDVSGSMNEPRKLPLIKQAFGVLVDQLRAEDRISIVVYAGAAGLVLPPVSGADKGRILDTLTMLNAGGSTAGGAGIELAYKIAQENFLEKGNNRVILATDGDFNVGISTVPELEAFIEKKRASDIFLSVLGVGSDNLQDAIMETLADKGNGNYAYLDSLQEAEKVFRDELTGTLVTIAKDVKVQIDFDPAAVKSYRQIGYENRALQAKDFDDDKKDAGELGAGHSVTALFEIVPASPDGGNLGTLRLRYKDPRGAVSTPLEAALIDDGKSAYDASPDLQFAAAVAELGMLLRGSPHKGSASWDDVLQLARVSAGADLDGTRQEFLQIAEAAKNLN